MKKLITVFMLFITSFAYAQGGFTGSGVDIVSTVGQVKKLSDDSVVTITGYVVKALGGEIYQFRTEADPQTIEIEIEHDVWRGITADETTRVTIVGEVETEWLRENTIEVDYIELAEQ